MLLDNTNAVIYGAGWPIGGAAPAPSPAKAPVSTSLGERPNRSLPLPTRSARTAVQSRSC
jgi:hypothetical protein